MKLPILTVSILGLGLTGVACSSSSSSGQASHIKKLRVPAAKF